MSLLSAWNVFRLRFMRQEPRNSTTMGVEVHGHIALPIKRCLTCGPIDLDIMHLCRDVTIRCANN
jgi:hypothetical protein